MSERQDRGRLARKQKAAARKRANEEQDRPDLSTDEPDEYELDRILADEAVDELEVVVFDDDEDAFVVGADSDAVIEDMDQYTDDEDVQEDFAERQQLNTGSRELLLRLRQNTSESPDLSADDIDAAWDESDVGDETVGGSAPTPDQDIVDELGEAVGLIYEDDEPLGIQDKMRDREEERWELDPESAEDEEEDGVDDLDEYNPDDFDDFDDLEDEDDLDELDDLDEYNPDDFDDFDDLEDEDDSGR